MQRQKNIRLLITLGVLIMLSGILFYLSGSSGTLQIDKELFRVPDQTEVNRIIVERSPGKRIELSFEAGRWIINKNLEADRQLVTILFATLLQVEPRRPIAERLRDSLTAKILEEGTHVQILVDNEVVKDFRVLGNERKTETYFQLDQDPIPYLVTIPGYRVYVGSVFDLTVDEWRDRRVFNFNWQNFKSLSMKSQKMHAEDFVVSFQNQYFGVEGLPQADTTRLNDFLDAVSLLQAYRYIDSVPTSLDTSNTKPQFTIRVLDIANREYTLDIYPVKQHDQYQIGRINRTSMALFERNDMARIARKRSDFAR